MIAEKRDSKTWQPVPVNASEVGALTKSHPEIQIVDQYNSLLEELFLLRNPKYRFDKNYQEAFTNFVKENRNLAAQDEDGHWFYFPWSNQLVHYLPEDLHLELRTGRNKNLITKEEQEKYYSAIVGIAGLSVGSHVAMTITMTGGAKHIKLADPDKLSGDNLNRIRTGYQNVGISKAMAVARQIFEMNPYAMIELYPDGVSEENLNEFLNGLDLLVEEMDNPYLKIKIRFLARDKKIPVVMAADNGDGNIADVERYDTDINPPILHGLIGDLTPEKLKSLPPQELPRVMARVAGSGANGKDLSLVRMLASVAEVGKSLYSWPQLGTAANLCGSSLAYLGRQVILKNPYITSGRYEVNLDSIFEKDYSSRESERSAAKAEIFKKMGM